jgi:hypothetical protein
MGRLYQISVALSRTNGERPNDVVLGRGAATGRRVLKPASSPGKASLREAKTAVGGAFERTELSSSVTGT